MSNKTVDTVKTAVLTPAKVTITQIATNVGIVTSVPLTGLLDDQNAAPGVSPIVIAIVAVVVAI
ncbi:hypothetical protein HK096_011649, partial [Nowakowskiella sp. JEL0078]